MAERGDGVGDDQWSWWESPAEPPTAVHEPVHAGPPPGSRTLQTVLLAVVVLLTLTLGVVTYWRFGSDAGGAAAAGETTTTTIAAGATTSATTAPTPVDAAGPTSDVPPDSTTTTTVATSTTATSTIAPTPGGPPAPPANVELVEIGPNSARIEWTSEECVGSRYQVGDFAEGGGGYPNVDRCWTDHVVLAGDPSFSPLLTPDTEYLVRIHAVGRDGQVSEPRFITIRTTSG